MLRSMTISRARRPRTGWQWWKKQKMRTRLSKWRSLKRLKRRGREHRRKGGGVCSAHAESVEPAQADFESRCQNGIAPRLVGIGFLATSRTVVAHNRAARLLARGRSCGQDNETCGSA